MKALKSNEIFGNWATILLPLNEDDSIDYQKLSDQVDKLISYRVNGIYSNGTASEFYNQDEYEFDSISEMLAGKCSDAGMNFQIGCSNMSPKISLKRVKRVRHLNPGAVQLILPDWYPPSPVEIIDFLKRMSDLLSPVGIVLYNPGHAKVRLEPGDFEPIVSADINLVGCKMGGGNAGWYQKMSAFKNLSVFVPGHKLATGISMGAHGSYSNVACIHPGAAQSWYELMLTDLPKATELETRIQHFIMNEIVPLITNEGFSDPAADKLMAAIGGWCDLTPGLRWPYRSVPPEKINPLREKFKTCLPEFV